MVDTQDMRAYQIKVQQPKKILEKSETRGSKV